MKTIPSHSYDHLRSAAEVQHLLGYRSRPAFWSFVKKAGLPCIRINSRRIMFQKDAIEGWLRHRSIGSHPTPIVGNSSKSAGGPVTTSEGLGGSEGSS
jgi:hypothetical protein